MSTTEPTGLAGVKLSQPLLDALRYFAGEPGMSYPSEKSGRTLLTMGLVGRARRSRPIVDAFGPVFRQERALTDAGKTALLEHLGTDESPRVGRWTMPVWMEPYRDLISNTGGNDVEDLMTRFLNDHRLSYSNMPVFTLACGVYGQVNMLKTLHSAGLLPPGPIHTDRPRHLLLAIPSTSANGLTTVDGVTSHLRPEGEQL